MQWHVYVDVLITSEDAVVLLREEGKDAWRLPGGWLTEVIAPEEVVKRYAREQVNLPLEDVRLVWAEARIDEPVPVLVLHYEANAPDYPSPGAGVSEARFFQVEHLPPMSDADRDALYVTLTGGETFEPF